MVIEEGQKLISASKNKKSNSISDLFQNCYECETLLKKLIFIHQEYSKMSSNPQMDTQTIQSLNSDMIIAGKQLQEKLNQLGQKIYQEIIKKIAEEFNDINGPSRKLSELITMPIGISFLS